jgi:hypothetical protein
MSADAKRRLIPLFLIVIQVCLLSFFAFNRLVDGDEGFYLSAAREVAQGKTLYSDFFYPQMPYLPHIFALFSGQGFTTLYMTRMASVAAALLTTLLFYLILMRLRVQRRIVNIMLAMYVFSGLVISWHSVAKTFAWTDLFLMTAFYFLIRFIDSKKLLYLALVGASISLAINTRLVLLPLAVLFLLPIMVKSAGEQLKRLASYSIPLIVFSIPALMLFVSDIDRFLFDNLGFHFIRNPGIEFPYTLFQRLYVAGKLLVNPQVFILMLAVGAGLYSWQRSKTTTVLKVVQTSIAGFAGFTALVITVIYLIPNPIHQQYFVQVVPFVLLAVPSGIEFFRSRKERIFTFISNRRLGVLFMVVYILGIVPYFVVYIGGVRNCDGHTDIGNMTRICDHINKTPGDDPILSELPLVSVLTNKASFDGIEYLGFEYPLPLNKEEKRYYRMVLNEDLRKILEEKLASFYVVVNDPPDDLLEAAYANYSLDGTFERFKIYRRKP